MSHHPPTDEQVRTAMESELAESEAAGRRATVTNAEKRLGVTHATFYRNYPELITWFKSQLADRHRSATTPKNSVRADDETTRLRRENTDLRKLVRIYAEAIRQLTGDKAALEDELQALGGVTNLADRRRHQVDNGHN
ncbi:galactokinase [Kitasatospora sp. MAA19]|uniref:hypothetical protein n=1 Tax=Kitasatospora sp. MAA19 TaxID=3035090 RepID=UPI0024744797|nr:hypothetical protein [Kitasatospora sp. MAA19]MDH6709894.1 galactokinase [Kitasatospora sp. MAA19]